LPSAAENVSTRNDNVNVLGPRLDGVPNFGYALGQWRKSCGKSSGDGGDTHIAAFECSSCCFYKPVVHANRSDLNFKIFDTQLLHQFVLNRLPGLSAQAENAFVRIVSGESREIHASYCAQQPRRLPIFFYGTPCDMGLRPAFHGTGIDSNLFYPIEVEWYALIRQKRMSAQRRQGRCRSWQQVLSGHITGAVGIFVIRAVLHGQLDVLRVSYASRFNWLPTESSTVH